jgi:hypothetical protein
VLLVVGTVPTLHTCLDSSVLPSWLIALNAPSANALIFGKCPLEQRTLLVMVVVVFPRWNW